MNGLTYDEDIRWTEPWAGHRRAFKHGWHDAQKQEYRDQALEQLTWQNLGYRLGKLLGWASDEMIDEAFDWCKRQYQKKLAAQERPHADTSNEMAW